MNEKVKKGNIFARVKFFERIFFKGIKKILIFKYFLIFEKNLSILFSTSPRPVTNFQWYFLSLSATFAVITNFMNVLEHIFDIKWASSIVKPKNFWERTFFYPKDMFIESEQKPCLRNDDFREVSEEENKVFIYY